MSRLFRALAVRNYRLMFFGALIANTGTWMHRVAQDWLVVELSDGSAAALGLIAALQFIPLPLVGLVAGIVVDRVDKRYVLACAVTFQFVVTAVIAAMVFTGTITLFWLAVLSFLFGCGTAFELPSRQSFVSELVPTPLVPNAVSLNSLAFNVGRSFGPAVGGLLLANVWHDVGPLYVIFCVAALTTLISLVLLHSREFYARTFAPSGSTIMQGLRYVWERPDLTLVVIIILFAGLFCLNFQVLIAMLAKHDLAIGPGEFGVLSSLLAVGAIAGAITAAVLPRARLRLMVTSAAVLGLLVVAAAFAPNDIVLAAILVPLGFTSLLVLNSSNSVMQLAAPPTMRGRLMGIYVVVMFIGTPVGAPLIGTLGEQIGARWAIGLGGVTLTLASITATAYSAYRMGMLPRRWGRPGDDDPSGVAT